MVVSSHVDAGNLGPQEDQPMLFASSPAPLSKTDASRGDTNSGPSSCLQGKHLATEPSLQPTILVLDSRARRDFTSTAVELATRTQHLPLAKCHNLNLVCSLMPRAWFLASAAGSRRWSLWEVRVSGRSLSHPGHHLKENPGTPALSSPLSLFPRLPHHVLSLRRTASHHSLQSNQATNHGLGNSEPK